MKLHTPLIAAMIVTLSQITVLSQVTYTAVNNGGWNTASTWSPSGIPGTVDTAIIPVGKAVTYGGTPSTVGTILISGTFSPSQAGTLGDVWVDTTGSFNVTGSGANMTFSGSFTNLGMMPIGSLGSGTIFTYSGVNKFLAGNISNVIANVTGSYQNVGTFVVGLKGTQNCLKGAGSFTNAGVLVLGSGQNTAPTVLLDSSTVGSLVIWTNFNGTATLPTASYYDAVIGQNGSSGWNLGGANITHNLTLIGSAPIGTWPANGVIGGKVTYSASSTTASTLPAAFSVGSFAQSSGKVAIPANGTLTVTGNAGSWDQTGGIMTAGAGGTVKFTGSTPSLGHVAVNNLLLDTTVTDATIGTSLSVTNNLTIPAGATLDVTALPGSIYNLLSAESLLSGGTISGSVATVSGSKVYAGGNGIYGTNAITGDLSLATGSTVNLDVNNSAASANDKLVVGGNLTLNNNTFNLTPPSAGASLDTANDYVLVTAASISGTPVIHWTSTPVDTNYSLVVSVTDIRLHYTASVTPLPPALNASLSGQTLTISWDSVTYSGFTLYQQTDLGGAWTPVSNGNVSPVMIQVDPTVSTCFYRLSNP